MFWHKIDQLIFTKLWLILPCYDLEWRLARPERKMGRRRWRPQIWFTFKVWGRGKRKKEKREKRAPALNMSFHQLVSQHGLTHPGRDTYLIQYHTNIQLNTYKPILCNITQILYTRGHLTYSVMSPYTIRDISCYVVCKMTDRLILLCNMLRCTVLHSTRPHPQKSLTKKIHLSLLHKSKFWGGRNTIYFQLSQIQIFFQQIAWGRGTFCLLVR